MKCSSGCFGIGKHCLESVKPLDVKECPDTSGWYLLSLEKK